MRDSTAAHTMPSSASTWPLVEERIGPSCKISAENRIPSRIVRSLLFDLSRFAATHVAIHFRKSRSVSVRATSLVFEFASRAFSLAYGVVFG